MKKILYALFFTVIVLFLSIKLVFADIYKSPEEIEEERKQFNALPKCTINGFVNSVQTKQINGCYELHSIDIATSQGLISITAEGSPNICDGGGRRFFPYYDKNYNEINPVMGMRILGVINSKTNELLVLGNEESSPYSNYPECKSEIIPEILSWEEDLLYFNPNMPSNELEKVLSDYFYYHNTRIFYFILTLTIFVGIFIGVSGSILGLKIKNKKST